MTHMWVGGQKLICTLQQGIVYLLTPYTTNTWHINICIAHTGPRIHSDTGVCRVSESLMYSANGYCMCVLTPYTTKTSQINTFVEYTDPQHCNTLQHTETYCNTLQHTATHCNTLQHTATHCNTLQHTATHCNTLQHTATHCNSPQHTATHCNTLPSDESYHTYPHIKRPASHVTNKHQDANKHQLMHASICANTTSRS